MNFRIILIAIMGISIGCNYPQEKILNSNFVLKGYDSSRGGVQIFSLNFDEVTNQQNFGVADQWITLVTNSTRSLSGWTLIACDTSLKFPLSGQIFDTLHVYNHNLPKSDKKGLALNLPDSVWIWNNTGHCTAIIDSLNARIDSLNY